MYFHLPKLSVKESVVPAFASIFSWDGEVFVGCCVNVECGFVAALLAVVFVANTMAVGGAEPALYTLLLDGRLELRNAAVKSLSKWASNSSVKFPPWGRTRVSL